MGKMTLAEDLLMKKIILSLLALAMLFSVSACSTNRPENAVKGGLEAFKQGKVEEIASFISDSEEEIDPKEYEEYKDVFKVLFGDLKYKIEKSTKTDDNNAVVSTTITSFKIGDAVAQAFVDFFSWALNQSMAGVEITEEVSKVKFIEITLEKVNELKKKPVTTTVDIKVTKDEKGNWKIEPDEKFIEALAGGLPAFLNNLEAMFES